MNTSFLIDLCEDMVFSPKPTPTIHGPRGGGGTPNFKWHGWSNGGKNRNPKKSHADFASHKNFQSNYAARTRRNYHESSDCFQYPKKFLLKSSSPKKYLPKFSYPNKILKSKISNPKKSFDHPCHLKSKEPPPPPPGSWTQALMNTSYWPLWSRHLHLHRRTGWGGEGGCSPLKFWATQSFWAARENLGKASF